MDALTDKYSYVVIDNEAGMEHLSRRTTREMDKFFIITDFTPIGLETAERIRELSSELDLKIKDVYLVINRIPKSNENPQEHPKIRELEEAKIYSKIFFIYNDDKLIEHMFDGKSLLELDDSSPVVKSVDEIIKNTSIA